MHRYLRWSSIVCLLLAGFAAGQGAHDVTVSIPDVIGIRIVGSGDGPRAVVFDYGDDAAAYAAAVLGDGRLLPTDVRSFSGVEVNATRRGRWSVQVVATPLAYTGPGNGDGLALGDVRVVRGSRSGLAQDAITWQGNAGWYWADWQLSTSAQAIASRTGATRGWRSLGFSGLDYEVAVQGDEDPGSYTTTVTYLLTAP
jgi:hypothetical protein